MSLDDDDDDDDDFLVRVQVKILKMNTTLRTWLEEQVLVYTVWTGNTRILNISESVEIWANVSKCLSISVTKNLTLWIYLNMRETWGALISSKYA